MKLQEEVRLKKKNIRARVLVYGIVQGVGFRPFVDRLAIEHHIRGWVLNSSSGVIIEAEGEEREVTKFIEGLSHRAPPLSMITSMDISYLPVVGYSDFVIKESVLEEGEFTLISPDIGTCQDCVKELFDPTDRRYGYPFINCTNCGPRYTIIKDIPYDRSRTTMKKFIMCQACEHEYHGLTNRRFHAQPNACWDCGPSLWLQDHEAIVKKSEGVIKEAKILLAQGKILAIKGLGGFHLVCDAQNDKAVSSLRLRKKREEKPLAFMVKDIDQVRLFCFVSEEEIKSLSSPQRPILLLKKKTFSLYSHPLPRIVNILGLCSPTHPYIIYSWRMLLIWP